MTKRHVLFIHGAGEGAHDADARLVANLRRHVVPDYRVRYPRMPNEADADYRSWERVIASELAKLGDRVLLVGHSVGASVVIKAISDGGMDGSLAGVFLIATPFWHDDDIWHWPEARLSADFAARLPLNLPLFFYHGREDEVVPFAHVEKYAREVPGAVIRRLKGRDHQLNNDLSEVAQDIRQIG